MRKAREPTNLVYLFCELRDNGIIERVDEVVINRDLTAMIIFLDTKRHSREFITINRINKVSFHVYYKNEHFCCKRYKDCAERISCIVNEFYFRLDNIGFIVNEYLKK